MADLTGRLLALGHRQLGVAGIETGEAAGPSAWTGPMRHRWDGVMDAIADSGLPEGAVTVDVVEVASSEAGGLRGVREVVESRSLTLSDRRLQRRDCARGA